MSICFIKEYLHLLGLIGLSGYMVTILFYSYHFFQISGCHLLVRDFFFLQGRNSRTNFLQEEGNDSILGSSNLFKDKNEALESQRGLLTRCHAKELQNKVIRLQVQIKKSLIRMESSRIKDMSCLGIIIILWSKFMSKKRRIRSQETSFEEGPNQAIIGPIWHKKGVQTCSPISPPT